MTGALLVTMPFATSQHPSIGLGLLKAALVGDGLPCDVRYLNLRFAERIGGLRYEQIAHGPFHLLGEWIFAADLFGDQIPPPERYFSEVLHRPVGECFEHKRSKVFGPERDPEFLVLRAEAGIFLDECLAAVPWDDYALVGFSTMFDQNTASLALARRLKERYPHLAIVFGGANCEGEMGMALHRLFAFVDYVCLGEGDLTFPLLARRILEGQPVGDIAGITRRVEGQVVVPQVADAPVLNMDALPVPNYDDFIEQRAAVDPQYQAKAQLLIETARGCWWGQKSHCTFCGLNGSTMQFRAKSPERALTELRELVDRYQTRYISAVDSIIDLRYFRDVLPRLTELELKVELFYETKANLRKEQVRLLREAGVVGIQPGIESLNSNVLRLMRKGVTALQNIQLLRWCAEYMVKPNWNLLAGFPGEDPADYARQAEIVPLLTHLPPPMVLEPLHLDRFSPLFVNAEAMGVRNVRASRAYSYVYPFSPEDLSALAYYFDFDYADGRDPTSYLGELQRVVDLWKGETKRSQLTSLVDGDTLVICDTRAVAAQGEYHLRGLRRAVYEYCDQARTRDEIEAHITTASRLSGGIDATLPAEQANDAALDTVLGELIAAKLTLHEDGRYLSLAVVAEYQVECLAERLAQGLPPVAGMRSALARLCDPRTPALASLLVAKLRSLSIPPSLLPTGSAVPDRATHSGVVGRAQQ
jgi:ribosomal peptide maturation radical SAM protein 1